MWLHATILLETLIMLSSALQWEDCQAIECGTSDSNMSTEYDNEVLSIGSCDPGYKFSAQAIILLTSDESDYDSHRCVPRNPTCGQDLGAGQSCCEDQNCASGTCQNGKCIGKDGGSDCTISEECKADYWCDNGICSEVTSSLGDACVGEEQCPAGSGCNAGVCVKLASLNFGQDTEAHKFCKSGFEAQNKCDEAIIKIDDVLANEPYACNIGQMCQYYVKGYGVKIKEEHCPCSGIEGATQSYCFFHLLTKGNREYLYERLQFDSSSCSGSVAHSLDTAKSWKDCGHYSDSHIEDWNAEMISRQIWPLYKSGVIQGCFDGIDLYDSEFESGSDTGQSTDQDTDQNTDQDTDQDTDQNTDQDTEQDTGQNTGSGSGSGSGNDNNAIGLAVNMLLAFIFQILVQYSSI